MSPRSADVLVVGAGPVGLATAALLARRSGRRRVIVADARPGPPEARPGIDARVYALSRASERILAAAGAWTSLREHAWPYRRMRVWEGGQPHARFGGLTFDAADLGEPDLGHIVEHRRIERVLIEALSASARVELRYGACVESLTEGEAALRVGFAGGEAVEAGLVIAADGAGSRCRALAGLSVVTRDYRQRAVVTHVVTESPHEETAWQRFLDTGPVALLPLGDGRSSVVWSTTPEEAESLVGCEDHQFCRRLTEATAAVLGEIVSSERRVAIPLRLVHARSYTGPRLALVGDAAHAVHPLAGQGVNLGFKDAATLAESIAADGDPGERRRLRRYERARKADNLAMLAALDGLQRLFGLPGPTARTVRIAGVSIVERLAPAKNALMRRALGLAGDVPAAARAPAVS